jgi:hypothetical protein
MTNDDYLVPPAADELEISLFGPGYGESIVIHIGCSQWILIDSCKNPQTKKPAALSYLTDLKVDMALSVRLVVATHWHDDHIRGISAILRDCPSAKIAISAALDQQNFLDLIAAYANRQSTDGVGEFIEIFRILQERKQTRTPIRAPILASSDKLLHRDAVQIGSDSLPVEVYSLSPSDASIIRAMLSIAELMPAEDTLPLRIPSVSPNYASVVLWIKLGEHRILLGADLETSADPALGWVAVLRSEAVSGKATVFKVAHHGSHNAHEQLVWSEFLMNDPLAVLTPFRRGNRILPTPEDIRRISTATSNGYITAAPVTQSRKWTNRVVRDTLNQATRRILSVHPGWGQIRLRKKSSTKAATGKRNCLAPLYH